VTLQVLDELKVVFKVDAGLQSNVSKTSILPSKGVTDQATFDMCQTIMQGTPTLAHLINDVLLNSFCPEDVETLDDIQDGFIHFQLLRFCQDTRLQYINSHIMFSNRCVLQQ
jgi:hypothetical protein